MRLTTLGSSRGIAVLSGLFLLLGAAILTGWLYLQVVKPGQRASYFIFMEDVSGVRPGRESDAQLTFFKSVGLAVQDMAAAALAFDRAAELGLGTEIDLS